MSVTSHVSMFRGEDISLNFQMTPPADITGWTLAFKCADKLGGTVQFSLTPSKPDAARGKFLVAIGKTQTSSLAVGRYVWDVRRTDANNSTTLANGTLEIKQEVTA